LRDKKEKEPPNPLCPSKRKFRSDMTGGMITARYKEDVRDDPIHAAMKYLAM